MHWLLVNKTEEKMLTIHEVIKPQQDAVGLVGRALEIEKHRIVPMAELAKSSILNALAELNGDKAEAARLLGIGKTTLYRKLKDYSVIGAVFNVTDLPPVCRNTQIGFLYDGKVHVRNQIVPMAELEKSSILNALAELNGDKAEAARLLGIGKTTLYRKLKDYSVTTRGSVASNVLL
jgi:transcriptional regulator of acetoin/glycerol metabolism